MTLLLVLEIELTMHLRWTMCKGLNLKRALTWTQLALGNQRFLVWAWLLPMGKSELSAVIAPLMSKCLWSRWKWYWGVKEMPSPFPCSHVIHEWSRKKTHIEKKKALKIYFRMIWVRIHICSSICKSDKNPLRNDFLRLAMNGIFNSSQNVS